MGAFLSTWSRLTWFFSIVVFRVSAMETRTVMVCLTHFTHGRLYHLPLSEPSALMLRALLGLRSTLQAWLGIRSDELAVYGVESGISSVAVRELAIDSRALFGWVPDKGLSVSKVSANELASSRMSLTQLGDVQLEQKNMISGPVWHNETNRIYILTAHELIGYEWPQANSKIKVFRRSIEEFGIHEVKVAGTKPGF